ncbi:MAG: BlaI/MecI/CopY family transcriptional regulator [Pirellula sp.]|nr:BlaI/MecI/CopY family transcriptional regulator [Pirellula sp.]
MARPASVQPTEVELQILNVLWSLGVATARQVHNQLQEERTTNYSTTVKMLKVMSDKGLVETDDSVRPQRFTAAFSRDKTGMQIVRILVDKVYQGSAMSLAMHAISTGKATQSEIEEMRAILKKMESKK